MAGEADPKDAGSLVLVKADTDDGWYKISNTLSLQLCRTSMNGRESRVFYAVMHKTFGFRQSKDWVSNGQIAELTGMQKNHVATTRKGLIRRKILIAEGSKIGINTMVSEWDLGISSATPPAIKKSQNRDRKVPELGQVDSPNIGTDESQNRDRIVPESGQNSPNIGTHNKKTLLQDTTTKDRGVIISEIPSCIDPVVFSDFSDHRKRIKSPMTPRAESLIISKLVKFAEAGHDPNDILNESIMNGWKGVFPPKGKNYDQKYKSASAGLAPDDTSWADDLYGPEPGSGNSNDQQDFQLIEGDFSRVDFGHQG